MTTIIKIFSLVVVCARWHLEKKRFFYFYFLFCQIRQPTLSTSRHISVEKRVYLNRKEKEHDEYFSHFVSRDKSWLTINCVRCRQHTHTHHMYVGKKNEKEREQKHTILLRETFTVCSC